MTDDEKRNFLLLDVGCSDFPFDEILSLEAALKKDNSAPFNNMRRGGERRTSSSKSKCNSMLSENKLNLQKQQAKITSTRMTKKNRPPLLKCPTWPDSQYSDGTSDNSVESFHSALTETSSISKLDSPSFYSAAAIDFSAISHLSEEHDKLMARENAEKKNSCVSDTTKEKLYDKASHRRAISSGRRVTQKSDGCNDSSCSVSSVPIENVDTCQSTFQSFVDQVSEKKGSKNRKPSSAKAKKALAKSDSSSEKFCRKRFSSSPSVTVSSIPISSLQNDENSNSILIESRPFPKSNELAINDKDAESKNLSAEKQPLPPEGFKISRYPLKNKPVPTSNENTDNNAAVNNQSIELNLQRLMTDLQKQLQQAEEKVAEAEAQAREWKEIARRTQQAVEVIKSQIEVKKVQLSVNVSKSSSESELLVSRGEARRWNAENQAINKEANEISRPHLASDNETILQFLRGNTRVENSNVRKRTLVQERTDNKRQCTVLDEASMPLPNSDEDKSQSLLAWLANAEPETEYLTLLQVPPDNSQVISADTETQIYHSALSGAADLEDSAKTDPVLAQRTVSHEEVRQALREKVGITRQERVFDESELVENVTPQKSSLQMQNSFDRFLDSFTNVENCVEYNSEATATAFSDDAKTPSSLPLHSPNIPSPMLDQSLSDSELHLRNVDKSDLAFINEDKSDFFRLNDSENDLSKILDDSDLFSQLDSILGF